MPNFGNPIVNDLTKIPGSNTAMFDRKGELNASSKKEALSLMVTAMEMLSGERAVDKETADVKRMKAQERRAVLNAALASNDSQSLALLGAALATRIEETTDREGFCSKLLVSSEIPQGQRPEADVKWKQTVAYMMSSASQVVPVEIRDKHFILNEVDINSHILITNHERNVSSTDLLEEKYEEGLESIMVTQDRYWKQLADTASSSANNVQSTTTFTPQYFAMLRDKIDRYGIPVASCIISSTLQTDIISGSEFQNVFDPVTQREILETGQLGRLYDVTFYTDALRQPNMRVIEDGEIYLVGAPINHGVLQTRPMTSTPIDRAAFGETKSGWLLSQPCAMAILNSNSVVKGRRI